MRLALPFLVLVIIISSCFRREKARADSILLSAHSLPKHRASGWACYRRDPPSGARALPLNSELVGLAIVQKLVKVL